MTITIAMTITITITKAMTITIAIARPVAAESRHICSWFSIAIAIPLKQ